MILNILLFTFLFDWYYKMVSPQNGDTWGGPALPPPLATPLAQRHPHFGILKFCHSVSLSYIYLF